MDAARTIKVIVDARQAEIGAKKYQSAVGGMARAGKTANRSMKGLDVALNSTRKSFNAAFNSLNTFSSALIALGGISFGLDSLIGSISGFERTLALAGQASRATAGEFSRLKESALSLGALTEFNPTQIAEGYLTLARAGRSASESISSMLPILDLALVGTTSIDQATGFVTGAINIFELQISDATRVADAYAAASTRADTNTNQLGEAIKNVGTIAKQSGLDIEQTAAFIGVLSDRNIKGAEAGTGLRNVLAKLARPSANAARALAEVGLSASDVDSEVVGVVKAIEKLNQADLNTKQLIEIFDIEGSGAAGVVIKEIESIKNLTSAIRDSGGEARRIAEEISKTLSGRLKALGSSIQALVLNIGEAGLTSALKTMIQTLTDTFLILGGMQSAVDKNAIAARALAKGLQIATAAAIGFGAAKLVTGFISLNAAIGAATAGTNLLTLAMSINPIGAVATALGAAAAAAFYYRDSVVEIGGVTATVGDFIGAVWDVVSKRVVFLGSRLAIAVEGVVMVFDLVRKASVDFLNKLNVDWGETLDKIGSALKVSANFILGVFDGIGRSIIGVLRNIANVAVVASDFDFSNPIESAAKLGEALNKAMSPTANFSMVKKQFQESLGKDFIGDVVKVGNNIGKQLSAGVLASPELQQGLADLQNMFSFDSLGADFRQSAAQRAKERIEAQKKATEEQKQAAKQKANDPQSTAARSIQEQERATTQASQSLGNFSQSVDATTSALNQTKNAALNFVGALISQPLQSLFEKSGISKLFGSANGNVFTGGARLMPFANGGVFDQPATFAMADGRTGLAFEAGPEAIMPLARDSQGRLGVRQQGGEGPRTVVNQTYRINVQTPNPDAFRMAPRQVERRARRVGH